MFLQIVMWLLRTTWLLLSPFLIYERCAWYAMEQNHPSGMYKSCLGCKWIFILKKVCYYFWLKKKKINVENQTGKFNQKWFQNRSCHDKHFVFLWLPTDILYVLIYSHLYSTGLEHSNALLKKITKRKQIWRCTYFEVKKKVNIFEEQLLFA